MPKFVTVRTLPASKAPGFAHYAVVGLILIHQSNSCKCPEANFKEVFQLIVKSSMTFLEESMHGNKYF